MDARTRQFGLAGFMRQIFLWALLPTLVLVLIAPTVGDAQVTTNITESGLGTDVPLQLPSDGVYNITGGTRANTNLFHSFGQFSVGTDYVANFQNTLDINGAFPATSNILARVTGGDPSQIYGTIRTTDFGSANLFLMNPAGVLFGATAVLDLGGSFYATTADYLKLASATPSYFYADPLTTSVLSVAPVAAFGFLTLEPGVTRGTISVQGSALQVPMTLDPGTGQLMGSTLSLVGGDINIVADPVTKTPAALTVPSGHINLVSVTSPGEILFPSLATGPNINDVPVTTMGTVTIKEGATLDVSGQVEFDASGNPIGGNSGTVFVRGGQLVMDASTILAVTTGAVDGAPTAVDIHVSQDIQLKHTASIITVTTGLGRGGDVQLYAGTLTMENNSQIATFTPDGGGVGGDVVVNVGTASLLDGASILSQTQNSTPEGGGGQGGNVIIQGLPVPPVPGADPAAGPPPAAEKVTLSGGSSLLTQNSGTTDGGTVTITSKSLTMDGRDTLINASSDVGPGGNIVLNVQQASLTGGARIKTLAGNGDPTALPNLTLTVQGLQGKDSMAESVVLSGFVSGFGGSGIIADSAGLATPGVVLINARMVTLADRAFIQAGTTVTPAAGGAVNIVAGLVDISGGSQISSQASNSNAGTIAISANTFTLNNSSITTETNSAGRGGNVELNVGSVSLANGATISSSSTGSATGAAGSITIQGLSSPADAVTITDSSLLTSSANTGQGGSITVEATNLTLNNATISASVKDFNAADASDGAAVGLGNVALTAPTFTMTGGGISAETSGTRNAGAITVKSDNATFQDGATISSASIGTATGAAGSVTIQGLNSPAQSLTLTDTSVLTSTNGPGQGGPITLEGANINLTNSTIATSSKGSGNAGDISINSKEVPGNTFEMWHTTMSTSAALADGGSFGIYATNMVRLTDSSITSSVGNETKTDTFGGNITIDPQFVVLQNSQILAQAFAGAGGNITIVSNVFLADPSSLVDASSQLGISGTVNILSPVQNIGGELTALTQEFSSAAALLAQQCAARAADGKFSTFVVAAREGLPAEPGGFLASPSLTSELLGSRLSGGQASHSQLSAFTGLFPKYDAKPIQLAKFGDSCHR